LKDRHDSQNHHAAIKALNNALTIGFTGRSRYLLMEASKVGQ